MNGTYKRKTVRMNTEKLTAFCALAIGFAAPAVTFGDFVLAERGADASCAIEIVSKEPSAPRAAKELSSYLKKITGTRLPVVEAGSASAKRTVRLEPGDDALGTDGFELEVKGDVLHVRGGIRGILYGTYEILERFGGVGWYSSWHEVVPSRDRVSVPDGFKDRQIPAFILREPFWSDVNSHEEFAVHIRKNGTKNGYPLELGGALRKTSRRFRGHTFAAIVPPKVYFKDHPEYFSEINGARMGEGGQLCCSNPDVIALVTRELREQMRKEPDANVFFFTPNDCFNNCQCANCRAIDEEEGSSSGAYVRMICAIAEALVDEFPTKMIRMTAYQWTRRPPKKLKKLPKNVLFSLAPIECDYSRPIPESPYKENVQTVEDLKGWSKIAYGNMQIFDYCTAFSHYPQAFPNVKSLKGNLLFYHENGVRYVINEGAHSGVNGASFAELKAWIEAKLLWNPHQDMNVLLDRFFTGFYGKGAPFARRYFDELEALPRDSVKNPLRCMYESPFGGFPDDAFLDRALELWRKAEAAVAGEPRYLRNVRLGKFSVQYMILRRRCPEIWATTDLAPIMKLKDVAKEMVSFVKGERMRLGVAERNRNIRKSNVFAAWQRLAKMDPAAFGTKCGVAEENAFRFYGRRDGKVGIKNDPLASGGKAARIAPKYWTWCMQLSTGEILVKKGEKYRVRLRARADFRPGAERKGTAFCAGLSTKIDAKNRRFRRDVACSEVVDGYTWYDIGTWSPAEGDTGYFWIALGEFDRKASNEHPDLEAVWIDQISFVAESAAEVSK